MSCKQSVALALASFVLACAPDALDLATSGGELAAGRGLASLAAGRAHACVLASGGGVSCWGANDVGQLGDGTFESRSTPVSMAGVASAISIAAGDDFTCALLAGGRVRCAGLDDSGQLGRGAIGASSSTALDVVGLVDAVAITAGGAHACALLADGSARCWGRGTSGQLGNGLFSSAASPAPVFALGGLVAIDAGRAHTCATTSAGVRWCWGELVAATREGLAPSALPVAVFAGGPSTSLAAGTDRTCSLDARGTAVCLSDAISPVFPRSAYRAIDVRDQICVVTQVGQVHCLGPNDRGQLGDGTTISRERLERVIGVSGATRVALGDGFSCAQHSDGTVSCWGDGSDGRLGDGATASRSIAHPVLGVGSAWDRAISVGGVGHTCALSSGTVRCWGQGQQGQLGDGRSTSSSTQVTVAGDERFIDVRAVQHTTLALTADGRLFAWGDEHDGLKADGGSASVSTSSTSPLEATELDFTALEVGGAFACGLRADRSVLCWGGNRAASTSDEGPITRGSSRVLYSPTPTGLAEVVDVAAGSEHLCGLRVDGSVVCRGSNGRGQLGTGVISASSAPTQVVDLSDAIDIGAGGGHTCAVRASGRVVCWGAGGNGQLGDGRIASSRPRPTAVGALVERAEHVTAGSAHTCALAASGSVWCWGGNSAGQLGDGTTTQRLAPVRAGTLTDVVRVEAAGQSTCAIRASGATFCWGENASGQLGDGTTTNRLVPTLVALPRAAPIVVAR